MKLINKQGHTVNVGDIAHTFRGEPVVVVGMEEPRHSGSTGRVIVKTMDESRWQQSFYPSVCNMEWVGETNY